MSKQQQLANSVSTVESLERGIQDLVTGIAEQENTKRSLQSSLQAQNQVISRNNQVLASAQRQVENKEALLEQLEEQKQTAISNVSSSRTQIQALTNQITGQENAERNLQTLKNNQVQTIARSSQALTSAQRQVQLQSNNLEQAEEQKRISTNNLNSLEQATQNLASQIAGQENTKRDLQAVKNEQVQTIAQSSRQLGAAQQQVKILQSTLEQPNYSANDITTLERQTEALTKQREELTEKVTTSSNFLAALKDFKAVLGTYKTMEKINLSLNAGIIMSEIVPAKDLVTTEVLQDLIKKNLKEEFDKILEKVSDINAQDNEGKTLLMHAVLNGFYYGVDKLLAKGADVNILDNKKANALFYCANAPHIKYIKLIADQTTDINMKAQGHNNNSTMHVLIAGTNNKIYADELNNELKDADQTYFPLSGIFEINENFTLTGCNGPRESDGYTINQEKTIRIVKYLISLGANTHALNDQGKTPLFIACAYKLNYVVDQLIVQYNDKIDFSIKDNWHNTALHYAVVSGNINLAKFLIEKKINSIDDLNKNEGTPLISAVACLNQEMIHYLIENGADINKCDKQEASPLYHSLGYNNSFNLDITKYLVENRADVNKAMFDGDTPMHMIGYRGNIAAFKILASKGANINAVNEEGKTPLHILMDRKEISSQLKLITVKLFLSCGAKTDILDQQGKSVIDLAKEHCLEAVDWLEHPERLPSIEVLESTYASEITNYKLPVLTADSLMQAANIVEVKQVLEISYHNELLNNFELLEQAAAKGNLNVNRAIDLSFKLDSDLTEQAINASNDELLLAGLMSLEHV